MRCPPSRIVALAALLSACRPAPCPQGCRPPGLRVVTAPALGAPCPEDHPCAAYLALAGASPSPAPGLEREVAALHRAHEANQPLPPGPAEPGALRSAVIDALALGPLLDGLDARPLALREVSRAPAPFGEELRLRVRDPVVGRFNLLLLRPAGEGPFPGIVALTGHGDDPAFHRDRYLGAALASAGFAVLIVQARDHRGDGVESEVTHRLLAAGRPLLGLRVYEALLARKLLRWRSDVDPGRVAVMGHSGGADVAMLAARVEPSFSALVIDHQSAFLGVMDDGRWLDDTVPALHRIHAALNDLGSVAMPVYQDAYEYPAGVAPLLRVLRRARRR